MVDANVPYLMRYKLFQEAVKTATKLDGLVVIELNKVKKTRYEHFGYSIPKFVKYL